MKISNHRFMILPPHLGWFALMLFFGIVLGACGEESDSSDSSGGSVITATDGDGIPEMSGAPTYSLSSVAIDSPIDVNVTVDTDTTHVSLYIGTWDGTTFNIYGQTVFVAVTPGSTSAISITPSSGLSAVAGTYYADVITCAVTSCIVGNPGRWYSVGDTFTVLNLLDLTLIGYTSYAPNSFTVTP